MRTAALHQLAERGFSGLTIHAVARRAGVARTTIYRHWASPVAIAIDALEALNRQRGPGSCDESPTVRVSSLLHHLAGALADPVIGGCVTALMDGARRDPHLRALLREYSTHRAAALTAAVRAGVEDEAFAPVDPETAAHALSGAVTVVERLIEAILAPARR